MIELGGVSLSRPGLAGTVGSGRGEDVGRSRGTTLVELVVAVAVATVALLAFFGALTSSASLDRHTRERTHAQHRATTVLEDLLARPWDDLGAQDGQLFDVPVEVEPGKVVLLAPAPGQARAGTISVTPWGSTGLRRVLVVVRWRSGVGAPAELRLDTLVGRRA